MPTIGRWTATRLAAAMADADVFVPTVTDRIDAALIAAAPDRLKLIANYGAGFGHIDLKAARERGITVTNTPGVLTEDTADMAMALILAVPRRLIEGDKLVRSGEWSGWRPTGMRGHRIGGKALGILGMGRIGQAVAPARARFRPDHPLPQPPPHPRSRRGPARRDLARRSRRDARGGRHPHHPHPAQRLPPAG